MSPYWIEEIVLSLPLIATAVLLMWPEKKYPLTPLHERKEPTLRSDT
jgi:hypothetical protein